MVGSMSSAGMVVPNGLLDGGWDVTLSEEDGMLRVDSRSDLRGEQCVMTIPTLRSVPVMGGRFAYLLEKGPVQAVGLKYALHALKGKGMRVRPLAPEVRALMVSLDGRAPKPFAELDENTQRAIVHAPNVEPYSAVLRRCSAMPRRDGTWSVPTDRITDLIAYNEKTIGKPFRIAIGDELRAIVHEPLPEPYDGSAESLRGMPLETLRVVRGNIQGSKYLKADPRSIADKMRAAGIRDLYDLVLVRPERYIDRSEPTDVDDMLDGEHVTMIGRIVNVERKTHAVKIIMEDRQQTAITCLFFNQPWLANKYKPGDEIVASGQYKPWISSWGKAYPQLQSPDIDLLDNTGSLPIMPMYAPIGKVGLSGMVLFRACLELTNRLGDGFTGPEWAEEALKRREPPASSGSLGKALMEMHLPEDSAALTRAGDDVAYLELMELMTVIEDERARNPERKGIPQPSSHLMQRAYRDTLPYRLTGAQERAVAAIDEGMSSSKRLHALLVGDVGSGKTTVMHLAALAAVEAGHQAVICAPTDILARQLYDVFMRTYEKMDESARAGIHPIYHGKYKGKGSVKLRNANKKAVREGKANLIFGTHSVLGLEYHDLSFVGVDEQQKFGAAQRSRLLEIRDDGHVPDMLMQTATPIPRSMAQVYYGDLTYLALDELPAGRQPITTKWIKEKGRSLLARNGSEDKERDAVWDDVRAEAKAGHGTFIVCPMVDESPKVDAASVKKTYKAVQDILPGLDVALVYGPQDKEEQEKAIERFKNGEADVLVASSVVEVGVSCEKATRMIVLDANRFGIASLHQIRGRIGRSSLASTCYLVASPMNQNAQSRMQAMCDTLDGWKLAQTDLRTRGSGSLFGTAQSGGGDLRFADLARHSKWIGQAKREAHALLADKEHAETSIEDAAAFFGGDVRILS